MRSTVAKKFTKQERLVTATFQNEHLTRDRVARIEGLLGRRFWGRLKWLLLGK